MLLAEWDADEGIVDGEGAEDGNQEIETVEEGESGVSLHALSRKSGPSTFKIKGYVGKKAISILIDSGSTNSFIDEFLVNGLKLPTVKTAAISVTIADGDKMRSDAKCEGFKWNMQGKEFTTDLRVLAKGGCDVVLGLDWMEGYDPIQFGLKNRELTIHDRDGAFVLKAEKGDKLFGVLKGKGVQKPFKQGIQGVTGHLFMLVHEEEDQGECHTEVEELLREFSDVFADLRTYLPRGP